MNVNLRKWINKKVMILLSIIIVGLMLSYGGYFLTNYSKDTITKLSYNDTNDIRYWDVEWKTERPYIALGGLLLFIGLVLFSIGVIGLVF